MNNEKNVGLNSSFENKVMNQMLLLFFCKKKKKNYFKLDHVIKFIQ